ncbi:MAG: universal stress protein [Chloroflexi bacterium]|nr:universal stress protein [Chloroflexota bacterium]
MFKRILLTLDGSEVSEIVLPYGEELAGKLGSEVILYHVRGHEHLQQEHMHQMYLDRLAETVRSNIKKGRPKGTEVRVTAKVEAGEPAESICNLVDTNKVDLIIMASVSTAGLKVGKMLGSVTDQVCRTVPIPVMLIRPQNIKQTGKKRRLVNHILIPLDGSELSKLALPIGEELATKLKVRTTLFRMATMIRIYDDGSGYTAYVDYTTLNEDEKRRVTDEMIALKKELKERGLKVTHLVTSGFDAANEIIEVSKKIDADLVVMSTHGQSGLGRWVFGSVAEKVLRHGETPLLLVHARVR